MGMNLLKHHIIIGCALLSAIAFAPPDAAGRSTSSTSGEPYPWSITLFNGIYTDRTVGKALFNVPGDLEKNYMHSLALSRHLARFWKDYFALEAEGMVAHHHGRHLEGSQSYQEYVAALVLKYDRLPWRKYLHTAIAVAEGLSWTSELPEREVQIRGNSQRLLNYLAFELELALPRYPQYNLVYRLHHRSGVFGLFGNVKGASDFYMLGLRYRF
jgi:hypothetical protein